MAGKITTQLVIEGINKAKKAFAEVQKDLSNTESAASKAGKAVAAALSFGAIAAATKAVVDTADAWQLMNARLKLATGSQDEFNTAQKELQRIASATASPIESLVTLYGRISRPLKEAGRSQQDILAVTEAVAAAFKVSGASAAEAENGVIQFAQALGSGALRGDEFNSVAEQAPRLMQALADGIGVPVGALKEMAAQGQLTASVVTEALLGELPNIRKELAGFGDTVGGEMVKIGDTLKRGIGQADTGPLKDALKELNETLSDPKIQENLTRLAGALVTLAEVAAKTGSAFAQTGNDIGYFAAKVSGSLDKLTELEGEIEATKASLDGVWSPGDLLTDIFYSEEELKNKLKELEAARNEAVKEMFGTTEKAVEVAERGLTAWEEMLNKQQELEKQHAVNVGQIRDQLVKDGEDAIKRQISAEKAAASDLAKAKQTQLETEQKFQEALSNLRAGPAGDASYGQAQALKVGARAALRAGDVEGAKRQAIAALDVLKELQAAGENTYGFDGFIKELQAIAVGADQLNVKKLEDSAAAASQQTAKLKEDLEKIKNATITPKLDPAALEEVNKQLQAFAQQIGQTLTIPVTLIPTSADAAVAPAEKYATGGYVRGPGSGTSDSIVARLSNGEYVMRAAAVRKWGVNALDRLNGLQLPKFADGGLVSTASQVGTPSMGTINLTLDGQNYTMQAGEQDFASLVRRQRMKRGSTR